MKVLLVVGTRPEAVKMAGLVYVLREQTTIEWKLVSTGQHRSMLDETFEDLGIKTDIDLNVMSQAQGLTDLTAAALTRLSPVIEAEKPDWVLVQGDTTTAFVAGLSAFYHKVAVGHVEAGLRTWNRYSPWPEEVNRKLISAIATRHFAPTVWSRDNLLNENVPASDIVVTGNTVIDALLDMRGRIEGDAKRRDAIAASLPALDPKKRLVLVTGHRRESFGEGFEQICRALARLAARGDVEICYPVHLNPAVKGPVFETLGNAKNIHLIAPQRYSHFVYLMNRAHILLTDSGGVQEEGPSLGKPVLVMRDTSERPEGIEAGTARLVGARADAIVDAVTLLLDDEGAYRSMSRKINPYGDGQASRRIIEALTS